MTTASLIEIIFWGVVTFSILVVIHEGGHFLAARAFGIKVHEFMIGLPGPALRVHTKSTAFGVTAVPFGGYVRIAGMEPGPEDELLGPALAAALSQDRIDTTGLSAILGVDTNRASALLFTLSDWGAIAASKDDKVSYEPAMARNEGESDEALLARARSITYRGAPTWKRIVVLAMGVAVNLAAAVLVFTIVLSGWNFYEQSLTLDAVAEGGAAQQAGIQPGDTITAFDGKEVADWYELATGILLHDPGDIVVVEYEHNGKVGSTTVGLGESEDGSAYLGVQSGLREVDLGVWEAFKESFTWVRVVFEAIISLFNPKTFTQVAGNATSVIGISVMAAEEVEAGPLNYAWFIAFLSLTLGIMNVLPIPPLDGGKIVLELVEKVRGRPLDRQVAIGLSLAGALLLFSLISYIMYVDVMRFVVNA
ncbi:MAG: M50 family metallopeptidase [Coriobacteriia bacterium]|nr:M50 family metallopeptidase [Coriobacteriia bacterium]